MGPIGGCLTGRRVILRSDDSDAVLPGQWRHFMAHELTHFLQPGRLPHLPPWLMEGLAEDIASRCEAQTCPEGAFGRWLRAARRRREILPTDRVLGMSYELLSVAFDDWMSPRLSTMVYAFYAQSLILVRHLALTDGDGFRRFLLGFTRPTDVGTWWTTCFKRTSDQVLQEALAGCEAGVNTPVPAPTVGFRLHADGVLLPAVKSRASLSDVRRGALRALGRAGYDYGVEALIEVLADPRDPMREEARYALEDLSGESFGDDEAAWRAHWEASRRVRDAAAPAPAPGPISES